MCEVYVMFYKNNTLQWLEGKRDKEQASSIEAARQGRAEVFQEFKEHHLNIRGEWRLATLKKQVKGEDAISGKFKILE